MIVGNNLHDAWMIQRFANFLLTFKTFEEFLVAFHIRMRNLQCDGSAGSRIGSTVNRRHVTASDDAINAVVIELIADVDVRLLVRPRASRPRPDGERRFLIFDIGAD